jgi:tRNA threonylcarbamoyladenosine biosynthesis protein TsaB
MMYSASLNNNKKQEQKDKNMQNFRFLVLYPAYTAFHFGIFQGNTLMHQQTIATKQVAADFLPELTTALTTTKNSLEDLDYCAVYTGPGSFTALRIAIAFANGFAFAKNLPLVGVNGFQALAQASSSDIVIISLQAFSQELYISIQTKESEILAQTCTSPAQAVQLLQIIPAGVSKTFIGNGTPLLIEQMGTGIFRTDPHTVWKQIEEPDLQTIAQLSQEYFRKTQTPTYALEPLYLRAPIHHL